MTERMLTMKKRKKILSVILADMIIVSTVLTGCSNYMENTVKEATVDNGTEIEREVEEDNRDIKEEKADEESEVQEKTEEKKNEVILSQAPKMKFTSVMEEITDKNSDATLITVECEKVEILGEDHQELSKAVSEWSKNEYEQIIDEAYDMKDFVQEEYDGLTDEQKKDFYPYSSVSRFYLTRNDCGLLSIKEYGYSYMGGAHGNYGYFGTTFDASTGDILKIEDILTDERGFFDKATEYCIEKISAEYADDVFSGLEDSIRDKFSNTEYLPWYLNAAGINIVFNPYEIGPYAMGVVEVTLPYNEFGDYIDSKYTSNTNELVASIPKNEDISDILGIAPPAMVEVVVNEYELCDVYYTNEEKTKIIESCSYYSDAYVIKRKDGNVFLMVTVDHMSDDYATYMYNITDGTIKEIGYLNDASVAGALNISNVQMNVALDVFGSYGGRMDYEINDAGEFVQSDELFQIRAYSDLVVVKDLPVFVDGKETIIEPGKKIKVIATNNIDKVYFECKEDGISGYFEYTKEEDSWEHFINGVTEYDYFEFLPYAG